MSEGTTNPIVDEESGSKLPEPTSQLHPAVIVITRTPKDSVEMHKRYKEWMERVCAVLHQQPGFISIQNYEPDHGTHNFFTHVVHFQSRELLQKWRSCDVCRALMREVQNYSQDEDVHILRDGTQNAMMFGFGAPPAAAQGGDKAGVEFSPNARAAPTPVVWKQCSVVICCLFPNLLVLHELLYLVGVVPADIPFSAKTLCPACSECPS